MPDQPAEDPPPAREPVLSPEQRIAQLTGKEAHAFITDFGQHVGRVVSAKAIASWLELLVERGQPLTRANLAALREAETRRVAEKPGRSPSRPPKSKTASPTDVVTARQKAAHNPAKFKCPVCEALITKQQQAAHNKAFHPRGELEAPISKKKRGPYPVDFVVGRKWGSDALDNAVGLNTASGIAKVKANRKKGGGGRRR